MWVIEGIYHVLCEIQQRKQREDDVFLTEKDFLGHHK